VKFSYNVTRALEIWHTPLEVSFWFSLEEPLDLLFNMRLSIPISQDASERLKLLKKVHVLVRLVLQLHKDEMQARSDPSTTPHFGREDKGTLATKNLFLRG
jgi:hypothetical protein